MSRFALFMVAIVAACVLLAALVVRRPVGTPPAPVPEPEPTPTIVSSLVSGVMPAEHVGGAACAGCHAVQHEQWVNSHHDLAMTAATRQTVLGNFDDATFTEPSGVTSTFSWRGDRPYVRTAGADGALADFEIAYAFGVTPLQQYLVAFPGGRYQSLGVAWDTRPADAGGQRWFHLYPDEAIEHDDPLHWTGPNRNWNFMCAECHSTDLVKGFDLGENRYDTTWREIDVSCEACHGPGSRHVEWARAAVGRAGADVRATDDAKGLLVALKDHDDGVWTFEPGKPTATRSVPRTSDAQTEACARCHARRSVIDREYAYGRPLLDTHRLALLDEGLYHADGQILDEVYVHGSFLQSRMHQQGVTCSDCHDPHSLKPHAPGNAVCFRCHQPDVFDVPTHHFHQPGGAGASCLDCHMPERTYMVVDPRRDHSIRIPRPDLSSELGTPNACNGCHDDQSPEWAADAVARWYGPERRSLEPHYAEAIHAGRLGAADAETRLVALALDAEQPAIARATAFALLLSNAGSRTPAAIERGLRDENPLVRAAALEAIEIAGAEERVRLAAPLLEDRVRIVRITAARILAPVPPDRLPPALAATLQEALTEAIESELVNAERPSHHVNVGNLLAARGRLAGAEAGYRTALRLDPAYVPAYVNLADLYRAGGRDAEGEQVLREALTIAPTDAAVHHALGLVIVRQGRAEEATEILGDATRLAPGDARFGYVYALALQSRGRVDAALTELDRVHRLRPADRDVLVALATISRDEGDLAAAIRYADWLVAIDPQDPGYGRLRAELEAMRSR